MAFPPTSVSHSCLLYRYPVALWKESTYARDISGPDVSVAEGGGQALGKNEATVALNVWLAKTEVVAEPVRIRNIRWINP